MHVKHKLRLGLTNIRGSVLVTQINIARMEVVFGAIRRVRGSTITVSVNTTDDAGEVLTKSVEKLLKTDCRVPQPPYVLLYPDGKVVDLLPGSENKFTVAGYKEFVAKSYQQITLFLCPDEHFKELSAQEVRIIFNAINLTVDLYYLNHIYFCTSCQFVLLFINADEPCFSLQTVNHDCDAPSTSGYAAISESQLVASDAGHMNRCDTVHFIKQHLSTSAVCTT